MTQLDIFVERRDAGPNRKRYGSSPQWARVLDYLQRHGSITQDLAKQHLGVSRLAARIEELRRDGQKINTVMIDVPTRWTTTARVAMYVYQGGIADA